MAFVDLVQSTNLGIELVPWDGPQLSKKLKDLPELVDDFFGRGWVEAFCGHEKAQLLGDRLDAQQVTAFRAQMGQFYRYVFTAQDPGMLVIDAPAVALSLEERFVVPDIYEQRTVQARASATSYPNDFGGHNGLRSVHSGDPGVTSPADERPSELSISIESRRAVDEWVAGNLCSVLLGGPGSGKSTVLRNFAIDMLREEPRFAAIARKWGTYLPLWVPFPLWTKLIAERGPSVSLPEVMKSWLSGFAERGLWPLVEKALADRRVLLLVDGIDEWTNEEAAGIALNKLQVFINQRSVPAVVASRPHAFARLGMEEAGWQVAQLADLTVPQQRSIARIWQVSQPFSLALEFRGTLGRFQTFACTKHERVRFIRPAPLKELIDGLRDL